MYVFQSDGLLTICHRIFQPFFLTKICTWQFITICKSLLYWFINVNVIWAWYVVIKTERTQNSYRTLVKIVIINQCFPISNLRITGGSWGCCFKWFATSKASFLIYLLKFDSCLVAKITLDNLTIKKYKYRGSWDFRKHFLHF